MGKNSSPCSALFFAAVFSAIWITALPLARAGGQEQQLIVFVQPGISEVDRVFQEEQLPGIKNLAQSMGISVHVVDAGGGAPLEVSLTPLMVYQNHLGRSIYQGRTTTLSRIRNFIRTSRFVPQGSGPAQREDVPVRRIGRQQIWAKVKVSGVTGTVPDGYDENAFRQEAVKTIAGAFQHFRIASSARLDRSDRGFYMDFYPWASRDGTLFLSLALYSQFHCKEPIYTRKKDPLTGPWQERKKLFHKAARLMERAVERQITMAASGDAFDPVDDRVSPKSFDELGFPLPAAPPARPGSKRSHGTVPLKWMPDRSGPDDPPLIQFRFSPPLDHYAGEVKEVTGEFTLPPDHLLAGATGAVGVDTRFALTMGEPVLDESIRGGALLNAREYPESLFTVKSISGDGQPVAYGRMSVATVSGTFTLKGRSVDLSTLMEIEPVIGEDDKPRLLLRTSFTIDLRTFGIEGADGPAPARYLVLMDINLIFKEKK